MNDQNKYAGFSDDVQYVSVTGEKYHYDPAQNAIVPGPPRRRLIDRPLPMMIVFAVVALVALTLGGCSTTAGQQTDAPPAGVNRPSTTVTSEPTPEPTSEPVPTEEPSPTSEESGEQKFGKAFTYSDGLSISVSAPKAYKPGEYAVGGLKFKNNVVFTVTIVNGTGATYDPTMTFVTMQSGNEEAEQIFDGDVGGSPSTKLLKGREATFKIAFNVSNPKDLVMEVTPDFEHEPVIFVS